MTDTGDRRGAGDGPGNAGSLVEDGADAALGHLFKGWLDSLDDAQKLALVGLAVALVLGPMGQGLLAAIGVLFDKAAIPNMQQVEATWWLLLITLPVAIPVFLVSAFWGRGNDPLVIGGIIFCIFWAVGQQDTVSEKRGDLYCYAELNGLDTDYVGQCREFDEKGFVSDAGRLPSHPATRAGLLTALAFGYTADARGMLMVFCGILAAGCLGYLVRRQTE